MTTAALLPSLGPSQLSLQAAQRLWPQPLLPCLLLLLSPCYPVSPHYHGKSTLGEPNAAAPGEAAQEGLSQAAHQVSMHSLLMSSKKRCLEQS